MCRLCHYVLFSSITFKFSLAHSRNRFSPMAITYCCSEKLGSLLFSCRTSQLRLVWLTVPAQNGKVTTGITLKAHKRGTYDETCTRLLERYLVGHVYRDNFHAYLKGLRGHCSSNFKARSC